MEIMPLHDGIVSGHLLHVGIDFFNEEKLEEARYTLEMAFRYNSKDADILYYLGLIDFKEGNYEKSEIYFKKALEAFGGHLPSLLSLGELEVIAGDMKKAEKIFRKISKDKRTVFNMAPTKENEGIQELAKRYVKEISESPENESTLQK